MNGRRLRTAALCAAVAMGLVACGYDSDDSEAEKTSTEGTAATAPAPASKGGYTPPGTKLAVGQTATVGWAAPTLSLKTPGKVIKLQVTVVSLEKGTDADLKGIDLNADQRGSTPYFLKVKVQNLGAKAPPSDEPDLGFDAFDDRRQEQGSVTFIGDFPRCEDNRKPEPFTRGKSYESCLTYLVPGGSIKEVRWNDGPAEPNGVSEYYEKPIVWRP